MCVCVCVCEWEEKRIDGHFHTRLWLHYGLNLRAKSSCGWINEHIRWLKTFVLTGTTRGILFMVSPSTPPFWFHDGESVWWSHTYFSNCTVRYDRFSFSLSLSLSLSLWSFRQGLNSLKHFTCANSLKTMSYESETYQLCLTTLKYSSAQMTLLRGFKRSPHTVRYTNIRPVFTCPVQNILIRISYMKTVCNTAL